MDILTEKLRAPALQVEGWLNSPPLTLANLRGQLILIDFWDYTCINCLHTLPYLQEWHRRYASAGLTIIGIHAPEFDFAQDSQRLTVAVQALEINYPVAQDNAFKTWNGFANRAWPAKYLVDAQGYIRAFHHGEGAYAAMELQIQALLHELRPDLIFPNPMQPLRAIDQPGSACFRPTPELYLGYARGKMGNREGNPPNQVVAYPPFSAERLPDTVYLQGPWLNGKEAIESNPAPESSASVQVDYQAAQVNCVMGSVEDSPLQVQILLDDLPVPEKDRGRDVALVNEETVIQVDCFRMFQLLAHPDFERHRLTLRVTNGRLRAYAFTFVGCTL
jgi:thiol-disulfide isomerase/thioredoxin